MYVEVLHRDIQRNIEFVINQGLLSDEGLMKYEDYNVHSILQYCLIRINTDLCPIPEYKVKLKVPIDKLKIDDGFKERKTRYQRFIKVDVAYLKNSQIIGFGEIFTPDEIHGVLSSRDLISPWITPRHKIEHLVKYDKPKFIIIVNVMSRLPPYKDAKRYTLDKWEEYWIEFIKNINEQKIECLHIIIKNIENIKYCTYITS